ncbi:MAG: chemotaxis protein CheW [Rhodobacteraceae bacterium]|nr:chemotaxis protein CheW [Paracoccaceae bacterium]
MTAETRPGDDTGRELLSFHVADQNYAFDILSVREIRGWSRPTPLPHAPAYLLGVINLRGTVLPVIDLAARLGMPDRQSTPRDVIIVVTVAETDVGLLVSAVSDILTLPRDALQPPPGPAADPVAAFVSALAAQDGAMIRLLDLNAVIPAQGGAAA